MINMVLCFTQDWDKNKAEHAVQSYASGVNYLSMEGFENVGVYWAHAKYMPSIFHEHAENILWTCWVYAMNILNICNKQIKYMEEKWKKNDG